MAPTRNKKEVRIFISLINYGSDLWDRRSHTLQYLTELTSVSIKFRCTSKENEAIDEIKLIESKYLLLSYPNFNSKRRKVNIWSPHNFWCNHTFITNLNIHMRHKGNLLLICGCIFRT